jgi:tRNA A37 methylthiotransferase MiaB
MVGKRIEILVTERQSGRERMWMGQDYGCKRTLVASDDPLAGAIVPTRVIRSSGMTLIGERIAQ